MARPREAYLHLASRGLRSIKSLELGIQSESTGEAASGSWYMLGAYLHSKTHSQASRSLYQGWEEFFVPRWPAVDACILSDEAYCALPTVGHTTGKSDI